MTSSVSSRKCGDGYRGSRVADRLLVAATLNTATPWLDWKVRRCRGDERYPVLLKRSHPGPNVQTLSATGRRPP